METLNWLVERVTKHDTDIYSGDGPRNPSITMRLMLLEDIVTKISSNLSKIIWLLITSLATGVVAIIVFAVEHVK